jgi:hypothetical protein
LPRCFDPKPFDSDRKPVVVQDGFLGQLAQAARGDRGFPKEGDAQAVSTRLNMLGADPDMHEALDDADLEWSSL